VAGALLAIPVAASAQIAVLEWWRFGHGEPGRLDDADGLPPPAPAEG
jgi:hypothetical protein